MSNLPISSKYRSQSHEPVSDAEREDLGKRLNDEFTKGTIDAEQYPQLLDRIYGARTLGELVPVVEALPAKQTYDQPDIVTQTGAAPPGELTQPKNANRLALYTIGGSFLVGLLVLILLIAIVL
ncbi:DUF1707 domain-containing protein [Tessaracoccus sp. SD287]|uniref:DUF1707 SHOCT-like domain-containing protein n=1 Tax=Tessaracoccus sp. SD287 TaxID=2782008 RepID=UPI001A96C535|nr:DUF1707 domain-containing protein [Tessaracoccus sp. SD287]